MAFAQTTTNYTPLYSDGSVRATTRLLHTCALVCRAWSPRAQMHMFAHIYVNSSKLSSISGTFQHKRFLSSYVRSLWIQRDEPDGVLISSLLVPYRMPKLECLRVNHLDLKQEHTSLSLFASTSSLRTLDLDFLQDCTSPQLLRFINAFPSISRLTIWPAQGFDAIEARQLIKLPKPRYSPSVNRSLQYLEITLFPGISRVIRWFINARPLVDNLRSITLYWNSTDGTALHASFEAAEFLVIRCRASLETLSIDVDTLTTTARDAATPTSKYLETISSISLR